MKIDNDCKERLRVFFAFGLEVYKIAMGTFLSLFVPKACEDDCPTSTTPTLLGAASFWTNAATFFSIIVLYTVELRRENWMIRHLDVDSDKPDSYLALVAPDDVKSSLHAWNGWYWKWAVLGMVLSIANVALSSVYLATAYQDSSTVSTLVSFSLLVFMKLFSSFFLAKKSVADDRAYSAYLKENTSFNVLDTDEYPLFDDIITE